MKRLYFNIAHHIFHYIILVIILSTGISMYIYFRSYPVLQLIIGIATSLFYVLWGIVHHYVDNDLSLKIVVEYLSIAIFAIIVLWNVLIL